MMENPHAERQAVILSRIVKNVVRVLLPSSTVVQSQHQLGEMLRDDSRVEQLCHCETRSS